MTESARVKELEAEIAEMRRFANRQGANIRGRDETIAELKRDRDAQAALVERMRAELENLIRRLEGPRIENMDKVALYAAKQALKCDAPSALQEFKERCWAEGAAKMQGTMLAAYLTAQRTGADSNGAYDEALAVTTASIVAELCSRNCPECKDIGAIQRGPDSKGNHFDPEPCPTCQSTASQTKGEK